MTDSDDEISPLLASLIDKRIKAEVIDLDHYRIRGGMAVETDYIIRVDPTTQTDEAFHPQIESFTLSKSYSAFRTLGQDLKKAADRVMSSSSSSLSSIKDKKQHPPNPKSVQMLAKYCETIVHLVESQRVQYLGKVNYAYVKSLATKRRFIINECLEATLTNFPDELHSHPFHKEVAEVIETFFLLDHCIEADEEEDDKNTSLFQSSSSSLNAVFKTPKKTKSENKTATKKKEKEQRQESSNSSPINLGKKIGKVGKNVGNVLGTATDTVLSVLPSDKNDASADRANNKLKIDTTAKPIVASSGNTTSTTTTADLKSLTSPVVPYSKKNRRSISTRENDEDELNAVGEDANLVLDDDNSPTGSGSLRRGQRPKTLNIVSKSENKMEEILKNNPIIVFGAIGLIVILSLSFASNLVVTIDLRMMLSLVYASFCAGWYIPRFILVDQVDKSKSLTPRAVTITTAAATPTMINRRALLRRADHSSRDLLRLSMLASPDAQASTRSAANVMTFDQIPEETEQQQQEETDYDEEDDIMLQEGQSPLPKFPDGAKIGSVLNCWSEPAHKVFKVRGPKYLTDKAKVPSRPFIFPVRAVDLFLTDTCPENVGSISGVLGGKLREKPTFIINFRLPWGVLLAYFEIPKRFLPSVRAGHEPNFDKSKLPSLDSLSNQDRCVARFLQGTVEHKNKSLKIVPIVVEGPWVVKSVIGTGKPALIGTKLPVSYCYQKAEGSKAMYLEADLDVVASSAARGILSVARTYTQVLTIDLGFVVQGNSDDELPEQMLVGCRLHGIDPLTAPPLPPSKDLFMRPGSFHDEDDDE